MEWSVTDEEVAYYAKLGGVAKPDPEYYKIMLPIILETVNNDYCTSFKPENLPANVKLFLAKAISFYGGPTGLKARKMGTVSYTYNVDELPSIITNLLSRYRRAKYHVFRPLG